MQQIDPDAWIAPSAEVYGRVEIGADVSDHAVLYQHVLSLNQRVANSVENAGAGNQDGFLRKARCGEGET